MLTAAGSSEGTDRTWQSWVRKQTHLGRVGDDISPFWIIKGTSGECVAEEIIDIKTSERQLTRMESILQNTPPNDSWAGTLFKYTPNKVLKIFLGEPGYSTVSTVLA